MKSLSALRILIHISIKPRKSPQFTSLFISRFYSAQPQEEDTSSSSPITDEDSVFDGTEYALPDISCSHGKQLKEQQQHQILPRHDDGREKANRKVSREEKWLILAKKLRDAALKSAGHVEVEVEEEEENEVVNEEEEEEEESEVVNEEEEDEEEEEEEEEEESEVVNVKEEEQMSLSVGIIGVPNAGKSALTNFMVGTKVSAVSRKTNTTIHEVLGVLMKENTQICFFDTPGLMPTKSGHPQKDMKVRVESVWGSVGLYDVLIVIFDVDRHLKRPDTRVIKLIRRMGAKVVPNQKRILCMNKVDLVEKKKDLVKVAEEFQDLPGYERHFMISGLKGFGVKYLSQYLMEQAVKRPWDEDPLDMSEELMKTISLEVVRERILDHVHQEVPYGIEHLIIDWKDMPDGSLRIEQLIITPIQRQRKILIGKNGSKIGRIGMEANEELRSIFKRDVHLMLQVTVNKS